MKVYNCCDYCRSIYRIDEVEGPEGAIEILGVCGDCLQELGFDEHIPLVNINHLYN